MSKPTAKPSDVATAVVAPLRVTDFSQLSGLVGKPRVIRFTGDDGQEIEIAVRPLSVAELQDCNAHTDIQPPMKPAKTPGGPQEPDWESPVFADALRTGSARKEVEMIEKSTGLHFGGGSIDERVAAYQALPASVAEMLVEQVRAISERPIAVLANFTSAPGSANSPS